MATTGAVGGATAVGATGPPSVAVGSTIGVCVAPAGGTMAVGGGGSVGVLTADCNGSIARALPHADSTRLPAAMKRVMSRQQGFITREV